MKKLFLAALVMFLAQMAVKADAASISVVPGGGGVYYVKGFDFTDIGGVEIEIQYDTATLANPRITQGSLLASTMFIPNPKFSASTVKFAAMSLSAIKGSGDLAAITFDLKGAAPGVVTIARSKLTTTTAATVTPGTPPATTTAGGTGAGTTPPGGTGTVATGTGATAAGATGTSTTSTVAAAATATGAAATAARTAVTAVSGGSSIGTITLPPDQVEAAVAERKAESEPLVTDLRKDMTLPLGGGGEKKGASESKKAAADKKEQQKFISYKNTLQLFKEFKGEKSAASLIPLFAEVAIPDFSQEPPIAFADGKTPLKITLKLRQSSSEAPKFMLQGANVKQLGGEGEDNVTWTIEALPKKDAVEATLTVIDGNSVIDFPLTVVPQINPLLTKGKALSEADFAAYLAKPARFDLNKDGKFDAVDDYIYTANYIVALKIKPEKAARDEKKEAAQPAAKEGGKAARPSAAGKDDKKKPEGKAPLKP